VERISAVIVLFGSIEFLRFFWFIKNIFRC